MKKNLKLLLLIPIVIFFASLLVIFFSPVNILPCETSATDPATSWDKAECKGYYLTTNPPVSFPVVNVNNSGFLINLVILLCGSFLFNGILFLIFFVISSLKRKSKLEEWDEIAEEADELQTPKKSLFKKLFKKEKTFEEKFSDDNNQPTDQ